jgi:hypothetical protein
MTPVSGPNTTSAISIIAKAWRIVHLPLVFHNRFSPSHPASSSVVDPSPKVTTPHCL